MKALKKYKTARRLGPIFEKTQTDKYVLREARRGKGGKERKKRRGTLSEFGKQLLEKQKVRFTYGVNERQFQNYVHKAVESVGSAAGVLNALLETRLDNIVYRLGLAPTRRAARQLVSHGHIIVNGKKITVPSYNVSEGDSVAVREGSKDSAVFQGRREELSKHQEPSWLSFDREAFSGTVIGSPSLEEGGQTYDLTAVIEFYSR